MLKNAPNEATLIGLVLMLVLGAAIGRASRGPQQAPISPTAPATQAAIACTPVALPDGCEAHCDESGCDIVCLAPPTCPAPAFDGEEVDVELLVALANLEQALSLAENCRSVDSLCQSIFVYLEQGHYHADEAHRLIRGLPPATPAP